MERNPNQSLRTISLHLPIGQSTDEQTGKRIFLCLKCNIEYIPANELVKRSSRFEYPKGPSKELLTANPPDYPSAHPTKYNDKRMKDLPALFKALQDKGFHWTSYHEH